MLKILFVVAVVFSSNLFATVTVNKDKGSYTVHSDGERK